MQRKNAIAIAAVALGALAAPVHAQSIPNWPGVYVSGNQLFSTRMLGEFPQLGHTTRIGVIVVPLTLKFNFGMFTFDPNKPQHGTNLSAVEWVLASPLFQNATFPRHPETASAPTQYLDAYQRSNFWNIVTGGGSTSDTLKADFHILLDTPAVIPRTLDVPFWGGGVEFGPQPRGRLNKDWFNSQLDSLLMFSPSNFLTVFLMDDVTIFNPARPGHTAAGFHDAHNGKVFTLSGFFYGGGNVATTAHELAEALVNPFTESVAPGWVKGDQGACSHRMEVGDPLEGGNHGFDVQIKRDGPAFHLPDLAFESWFARSHPSTAINGWVTFEGVDLPNPVCH